MPVAHNKRRPYVFIGSSSEGLEIAQAVQANIDRSCESQIWSQGLFGLSEGNLETLVDSINGFDFAILVLTPDDLTTSRKTTQQSPRDNILFELGLFIGGMGRNRVFMVVDRSTEIKLPSDLAGITPATFQPPVHGTLQSALGAACTAIESKIKNQGLRPPKIIHAWSWTGCLDDGYSENPDLFITVANRSNHDVPWLNVHVFPSNTFKLEPMDDVTDRLMASQLAHYRFRVLDSNGRLEKWAQRFLKKPREELSIRIFKSRSAGDAVLIDYDLGAKLHDRIKLFAK
jgi:CAP12/Pycsar effector protein, TIR domain